MVALWNGAHLLENMNFSFLEYAHVPFLLFLLAILIAQLLFSQYIKKISLVFPVVGGMLVIFLQFIVFAGKAPIYKLSYEYEVDMNRKGRFVKSVSDTQRVRGYIVTAFGEIYSSRFSNRNKFQYGAVCCPDPIENIPVVDISNRLVIIQVECLGFELLDTSVNGKYVMPYLQSLQDVSFVVRLDGTKKLASANSDYEILNTREASSEIVHYEQAQSFTDNIILNLRNKGWHTSVYHGYKGKYMNLRTAYTACGFEKLYFFEEYQKEKFPILPLWGGMIADEDLFTLPQKEGNPENSVQFIITMTMHVPEYINDKDNMFPTSSYGKFYTACLRTDQAIKEYIKSLPLDSTIILYGDHTPYFGETSDFIPFIIYKKGHDIHYDGTRLEGLTRCNISHYLRKALQLPSVK